MPVFIELKAKAIFSIVTLIVGWIFAQASVAEMGFDQAFSIGLLLVAVITVWRALVKKDDSETKALHEQIAIQSATIKVQKDTIEHQKDHIKLQKDTIEHLNDKIKILHNGNS